MSLLVACSAPADQSVDPTISTDVEPTDYELVAFYSDRDSHPEIFTYNVNSAEVMRLTDDPAFDDSPALSPDGSRIVFLTARHDPQPNFPNLKYEIYVMNVDGSNLMRLTNTDAAEDHPSWSRDGEHILFDADYDGDGYYEIYVMDADGGNMMRLTFNDSSDQFADWSPDGTQIAYSSYANGNWDICVMDADGDNSR